MSADELVVLETFRFVNEAELASSVLDAAGIDSMIRDAFLGGVYSSLTLAGGGVTLYVRADDVERARAVLHDATDLLDESGDGDDAR
jgi:hypothetical protein